MLAKGFGGAERFFVDLTCALAEAGHEVLAICHPRFRARANLADVPRLRLAPVPVFGYWDPFAPRCIQRRLIEFRPQVIQAHLARGAHISGKSTRSLGVPLVVKLHDYVDLKYYRKVDVFVPTTADQASYLLRLGILPERVRQIPNFSALTPVAEARQRNKSARPTVLAYGRMVPKKGFEVLLRAARALLDAGVEFQLRLGGDGPDRFQLERLARSLQLGEAVQFTGWIDNTRAALVAADLFVLPSLDEPFGIAVLEAMASGVPIVSTRTQGPREILTEGTAFLVEPADTDMLAREIQRALTLQDEARAKATRALDVFNRNYSAAAVMPQFLQLYAELSAAAGTTSS